MPPTNCDIGQANFFEPWCQGTHIQTYKSVYVCLTGLIRRLNEPVHAELLSTFPPHYIHTQCTLASVIISVLLSCPHFVLVFLDVICFVNDPIKMYCLNCTSALKRFIVLYSIILPWKIYPKDIVRDVGKYFFKSIHHSAPWQVWLS